MMTELNTIKCWCGAGIFHFWTCPFKDQQSTLHWESWQACIYVL